MSKADLIRAMNYQWTAKELGHDLRQPTNVLGEPTGPCYCACGHSFESSTGPAYDYDVHIRSAVLAVLVAGASGSATGEQGEAQ